VPIDFYAQLGAVAVAAGARFALDSSGPALVAGLAARPDVIKPNASELAEATGRPVVTVSDAVQAAEALRNRGAGTVVVSLGRDGALLVDDDGTLHAKAVVHNPKSTVGAGDALLAGYLAGRQRHADDPAGALREAVAWGSGAVATVGSHVPAITDADRRSVEIMTDVELGRPLDAL
jgi:fructose-1-phosphate kinase PfkB-like protein